MCSPSPVNERSIALGPHDDETTRDLCNGRSRADLSPPGNTRELDEEGTIPEIVFIGDTTLDAIAESKESTNTHAY